MAIMPEAPTSTTLASGVTLDRFCPGGKDGPDGAVLESDQVGGGLWSEFFFLGRPDDPWRMLVPDLPMARNQLWPMHWHDSWIAIMVPLRSCMVGDQRLHPADRLIS